jgi:hypothetical protein
MPMVEPAQLAIRVGRPVDAKTVLEFFERTEYAADTVDALTVALTPPEPFPSSAHRREIQIYLRILRRTHPDVDVVLMD